MSPFAGVQEVVGDPIIAINEEFLRDTRENKVNLSIGIYKNEAGEMLQLNSIRSALSQKNQTVDPASYLPIEGDQLFCRALAKLILGVELYDKFKDRLVLFQTVGASGALRLTAELFSSVAKLNNFYLSDPTWSNHSAIFKMAGFNLASYPYFEPASCGLNWGAMAEFLHALAADSLVLPHSSCHNPTGVDLDQQQWDQFVEIAKARKLISVVDVAYQGFATSIEHDVYGVRELIRNELPTAICYSCSKNFSLYRERVGMFLYLAGSPEEARVVTTNLRQLVRMAYSSPPANGASLVRIILEQDNLKNLWMSEVEQMRSRIKEMRQVLSDELAAAGISWDFILKQNGMFSFTPLTPEQVEDLKARFGIYLVKNGRICVAALNRDNVKTVASAIRQVL